MKLSQDQQEDIREALAAAEAALPCSRCGHRSYTILDGFLLENAQSQLQNLVISGDNRVACVATVCERCGCLTQHVMDVLYGGTSPRAARSF